MLVQVYVLPAEAQQLRPAQAGKKVEGDGGPPLDRLSLQQLQEPPGVVLLQIGRLMAPQAGLFRCVCWVNLDISPLDRPGEDGGEGTVVGDHAGGGQRFPVGGEGKGPGGLHPHGLGDGVSGFPVDGLALHSLLDGGPADAGAVGKGGHGPPLCADLLPQVDFADGGGAVADPLLLEVLVKAVDVAGTEVTKPDVAEGLIDAL